MKTTASSLRFQTMVKEQTKKTNSFVGGRKGVFFFFFSPYRARPFVSWSSIAASGFFCFFFPSVNAVGVLYVDRVIVKWCRCWFLAPKWFLTPNHLRSLLSINVDVCGACLNSNVPVLFPIFDAKAYVSFLAFISLMSICEMLTSTHRHCSFG